MQQPLLLLVVVEKPVVPVACPFFPLDVFLNGQCEFQFGQSLIVVFCCCSVIRQRKQKKAYGEMASILVKTAQALK